MARTAVSRVSETRHEEPGTYARSIRVTLTGAATKGSADATLFTGRDARVVEVDGLPLEFRPEGTVVYLRNRDVPGVVGGVGTILGEAGVNIADFSLARGDGSRARPRSSPSTPLRSAAVLASSRAHPAVEERGVMSWRVVTVVTRTRVVVLFGGQSVEREVSRISARTIAGALDPSRYEVVPLAVGEDGRFLPAVRVGPAAGGGPRAGALPRSGIRRAKPSFRGDHVPGRVDVVFPIIHGTTGEDGVLQGFLETLGSRTSARGSRARRSEWTSRSSRP